MKATADIKDTERITRSTGSYSCLKLQIAAADIVAIPFAIFDGIDNNPLMAP